jgi:hypothetical protein
VLAQTQWTCKQRLSPENKGVSPYIPLQAGYRSKKQSLTHIWLHMTLLVISFLQCYMTFLMFQFFKFISLLCHPFPLLHYQNTNLSVSFLVLLPATLFPLLMQGPNLCQRASSDLGICIFIASLHGRLFSLYSGLYNGPDGPQYQGNQAG